VEYVPLSVLVPAVRNPRTHDLPTLTASIARFGYVEPVLEDERTGRLVAGHGRLEALAAVKAAGAAPPVGVRTEGDEWLLPVLKGVRFADDREAEAYLVAANRLVETGGWDPAGLAELLADLSEAGSVLGDDGLLGIGYDEADIEALLKSTGYVPPFGGAGGEAGGAGAPGNGATGEAGEAGEAAPDSLLGMNSSQVKSVNLFMNLETHAHFTQVCAALGPRLGTDNLTDTVLAALDYAYAHPSPEVPAA